MADYSSGNKVVSESQPECGDDFYNDDRNDRRINFAQITTVHNNVLIAYLFLKLTFKVR